MQVQKFSIADITFVNELDINSIITAIYETAILKAGFKNLYDFEIYANGLDSRLKYFDGQYFQSIDDFDDLEFYSKRTI